jgi:hypothetical protein
VCTFDLGDGNAPQNITKPEQRCADQAMNYVFMAGVGLKRGMAFNGIRDIGFI